MSDWTAEVSGDRRIDVSHSDGHRWHFHFPDGWKFGLIPQYEPAHVQDGKALDYALPDLAAMYAVEKARRERWVP